MSSTEFRRGLPDRFYDTASIERDSAGYTHFFDRGAKRFFLSRIGQNAYPTANPFITLFVTSERFDGADRYEDRYVATGRVNSYGLMGIAKHTVMIGDPRRYTIRSYDWRTRSIGTVGEFQAYDSSRAANREARRLAGDWNVTPEDWHAYALALNEEYDSGKRRAMARGDSGFCMYEIGAVNDWISLEGAK